MTVNDLYDGLIFSTSKTHDYFYYLEYRDNEWVYIPYNQNLYRIFHIPDMNKFIEAFNDKTLRISLKSKMQVLKNKGFF